jgi:HEAT repeat protein
MGKTRYRDALGYHHGMGRKLKVLLTVALLALGGSVRAEPPPGPGCETVQACIARVRELAHPGGGITPSEGDLARRLQSLSPQSISPVVDLLGDPDENVRELAGYILRDMPGLRPGHLTALERAVEEGDGWLPPAIASIGTPEAVRFLVGQLKRNPETGTQLTYAFKRLGPTAFPELLELFRCDASCDESLLLVVGSILSEVRESAGDVVEPLATIASEQASSLTARRGAIRALGGLGTTARPAVNALLRITHDGPVALRNEARGALLAIGGPGTREALVSSLEDAKDKRLVLRDIAALGKGGHAAGPQVERLLSSGEPDVRVAAARTLGRIGYLPGVPSLVTLLGEPDDWRLVYVAAEALGRLQRPEARPALQETASHHWYPPVRDAARNALRGPNAKSGRASSSPERNSAFEFFDYEYAGQHHPPCADLSHYPPLPSRPETLDPIGQSALAEQLAYDRVVESWDDKGRHTTSRRTIPQVGLRLEGGWLVGANHGEWGGEVIFKPDRGVVKTVLDENVTGLHLLNDGRIVAVTGLAHLMMDSGALYRIACTAPNGCSATWWKALPGAPRASWFIETGELLINTTGGSVLVAPDGRLSMADCHSARAKTLSPAPR